MESWVVVLTECSQRAVEGGGERARGLGNQKTSRVGHRVTAALGVGVVRSRVTLGPSRDTHGTHEPGQLIAGRLLLITVLGPLLPAVGGQPLLQAVKRASGPRGADVPAASSKSARLFILF